MSVVWIISLVIGLLLFLVLLASRSWALQRFAVMELMLAVVIAGGAAWGYRKAETFSLEQYLSLFGVYLQQSSAWLDRAEETELTGSAGEKESLAEMLQAILPVTTVGETSYTYRNAAVLSRDADTYSVLFTVQGETEAESGDGMDFPEDWMEEAELLTEESLREHTTAYRLGAGADGTRTGLLAATAPDRIAPKKALFVEISLAPMEERLRGLREDYMNAGSAILLIGTLLLASVTALQGAELGRMVRVMNRVGEGKEEWEWEAGGLQKKRYRIYSREMRSLWNSLGQIVMGVARIHYDKYRRLQTYYRFAPKRIEELLNKNSILDVAAGDSVHTSGVLALVSMPGAGRMEEKEYIGRMNARYLALCRVWKEYGGIFLAGGRDLTMLELMFTEQTNKALNFGMDAVAACMRERLPGEDGIFVLLHRTGFVYGVAGDEEQASAFVLSDEMKFLEKYTDRLRRAGIRMAVTDTVYEVVEKEASCRYIGFIEGEGRSFQLYEILDACSAKERRRRLETISRFREGLSLYYQDDFYLARSAFTEVLKECPSDEVAKWYVFACERCLNQTGNEIVSHGFLADGVG
ncbi:MAG: hypothetical protein Q4C65_06800 [Eubacteriales bacterium]|nr:hypothetical protein [Eubacteriales bacterium]